MFCPHCGNEIDDNASFCGGCGNKITKDKASSQTAKNEDIDSTSKSGTSPSTVTTAKVTASAVGSVARSNPKLFIGVGAAVVALVVGIIVAVMFMTGGFTGGQTAGSFRNAFESQQVYTQGLPSTSYVDDTTFDLISCDVTDIKKQNNDWVTANIDAVAESDNYKVTMQFAANYFSYPNASKTSNDASGNYEFGLKSEQIEAKTGITKDDGHGLYGVTSELSEDGRACTYVLDDTYDFWFADSSINNTLIYALRDYGWDFDSDDVMHKVTYKDIDGNYAARTGTMTELSSIKISNLNAESGSFNIEIAIPEKVENYYTQQAAVGTLTATIDPQRAAKNGMKDGYSYYFEARGSSTGGNGQSTLKGYFKVSDDGSKTIEITSGSIDITRVPKFGSAGNYSVSFDGTIYKQ